MSSESSHPVPEASDAAEPTAMRRPVPVWLLILLLLMVYWGMVYFDQHGGWFSQEVYTPFRSEAEVMDYQPKSEGPDIQRGRAEFEKVCALCHNPDGMGKPGLGPPFAGSEWVQGSPARLIRIPLFGLNGPITVKGQEMSFPQGMPPMREALPQDDLAAVLTYMRQAWGNKAPPITAQQIKEVNDKVGNSHQPFAPKELLELPEK